MNKPHPAAYLPASGTALQALPGWRLIVLG
nr:MAG TPA: hypothetical protein [Caudoviricetes sp.]